mgnify:FL=1
MGPKQWRNILEHIGKDERINVWHLALFLALLRLAYDQKEKKTIKASRSKLMQLSHIRTLPTYHKYFKELQDFGYIEYSPSYHPGFRSTVTFKKSKTHDID